jgi:hypothetical protein
VSQIIFRTPSGPIVVSELVPERKDVAWLVGPYRVLDRRVSESPLAAIDARDTATEILIDAGRIRLFRKLSDPRQLSAATLDSARVMDYCSAEKIDGICLFTRTGERNVRMRVFTTSLDGREDISTGGAVMGLLPYLHKERLQHVGGLLDCSAASWALIINEPHCSQHDFPVREWPPSVEGIDSWQGAPCFSLFMPDGCRACCVLHLSLLFSATVAGHLVIV